MGLTKELWALGHRYRKNDQSVYGKPNLIMTRSKLAIFFDGEFWHGKEWEMHKKIETTYNVTRMLMTFCLNLGGRFYDFGERVTKYLRTCPNKIISTIDEIKRENQHR